MPQRDGAVRRVLVLLLGIGADGCDPTARPGIITFRS
jgi:hypothetical protein